jgi:uncharacterized membrane protein
MNYRQVAGIGLLAAAACVLAAVATALLNRPPLAINTTVGEATIHLSASRSETLFPNDCVTVSRSVEHIRAIYLNGDGRTGTGQERFCRSRASFRIELPDGTEQTYVLRIQAWITPVENRLLLWLISALVGAGLVCLGWLPGLRQLWDDAIMLGRAVKRSGDRLATEESGHLVLLLVIILAGVAIRLVFLPHEIGIDEVETFNHYASQPLSSSLSNYNDPNNHLLNTLLMHLSFELFGAGVWFLRLPALIAGILIIPAAYGVARGYYNREVGLLTAAFVASAWYLVYMSVNARGYSLQTLFFLLSLGLACYLLHHENTAAWVLFAIAAALGFYAVPTALYAFAGLVTWLFLSFLLYSRNKTRQIRHLLVFSPLAAWLTMVLYSPSLVRHGLRAITANQYVRPQSFAVFLDQIPTFFRDLSTQFYLPLPRLFAWVVLLAGAAALLFHRRIARHRLPVILPLLAIPPALILVQRVVPFVRVWTYLLPVVYMLAAAGAALLLRPLQQHWKRTIQMAALGALIIPGIFVLQPRGALRSGKPYQDITRQLKSELRAGDTVVSYNPVSESLIYYFRIYDVSGTYFYPGKFDTGDRIVVVVQEPAQSLDWVLNKVTGTHLVPNSPSQIIAQSRSLKAYAVDPQAIVHQ